MFQLLKITKGLFVKRRKLSFALLKVLVSKPVANSLNFIQLFDVIFIINYCIQVWAKSDHSSSNVKWLFFLFKLISVFQNELSFFLTEHAVSVHFPVTL